MKIALVIGHSRKSQGACNSITGLTEFNYNSELVKKIKLNLAMDSVIVERKNGYKILPAEINYLEPDFIISFHCNAFNKRASGTEMLHYHKSEKGKKLAIYLQEQVVNCLKLPDRGVKGKTTEDRGGYILRYTKAPCVVAEPFFIDNLEDLRTAQTKEDELVVAYCRGIMKYFEWSF